MKGDLFVKWCSDTKTDIPVNSPKKCSAVLSVSLKHNIVIANLMQKHQSIYAKVFTPLIYGLY
jgi:hypothetical protein